MTKRKTPGERIAERIVDKVHGYGGDFDYSQREYARRQIANAFDRAIRRAQAEAWDDGYTEGSTDLLPRTQSSPNPYRGRARK